MHIHAGLANVSTHTECLGSWLAQTIRTLHWSTTGQKFALLPEVEAPSKQGSSVSFFPHLDDGKLIPAALIEAMAKEHGLAVRTGCFCNPGTGAHLLGLYHGKNLITGSEAIHALEEAKLKTGAAMSVCLSVFLSVCLRVEIVSSCMHTYMHTYLHTYTHTHMHTHVHTYIHTYIHTGLVRASVGFPTTFEDVYIFVNFLRSQILARPKEIRAATDQWLEKVSSSCDLHG
jgi:selenocysteine lyase/cysteine desulfurase